MAQAISTTSVTGFATELAELMIQNETTQSDANHTEQTAARTAFLADAQHQVDALHDAASATRLGAFVNAAMTVAGGLCEAESAASKYQAGMTCAKLSGLSPCSDNYLSTAQTLNESHAKDALSAAKWETGAKALSSLAPAFKSLVGDATAMDDNATAKKFETLGQQAQWQASDASSEIDKADKLGGEILDILQGLEQAQDSAANAVIGRI